MPAPTSLSAVIQAFIQRFAEDLFWLLPAEVVEYHPDDHTVDVKLALKISKLDPARLPRHFEVPVLERCPVIGGSGGGFAATFPLAPGDGVAVAFSTQDASPWELGGDVPAEVSNLLRGGLSSCVVIPGWRKAGKELAENDREARQDHMIFGRDGGVQVRISEDKIYQGRGVTSPVATKDTLASLVTAIKAALSGVSGANPGALDTWVSNSAAAACAQKVEAE